MSGADPIAFADIALRADVIDVRMISEARRSSV
jgi:hypothetical protein